MALNLTTLLADFNGTAMATGGTAEWGFIPDSWFLAIPNSHTVPQNYTIGTSYFTNQNPPEDFIKANYHKVRAVVASDEEALFIATLRMALAEKGIICSSIVNRGVIEDEYVTVNNQGANWADALNDIPNVASRASIAKFCKRYGPTIMHQLAYVFAARGHHWQPSYNELYDRLRTATFMPSNPGFQLPSNETIYRLAIHCFGIRPLNAAAVDDHTNARMAAAMMLRFAPSTPIAGVAHITTLKATLDHMEKESWWAAFDLKFHQQIADITAEVALIHANPSSYHVAAKVYGINARLFPLPASSAAFNRLSQFALGYIDHLGRRHSLAGQQAITKKAGGMMPIAEAFSRACDRFGKPDVDVDDMTQFLAQL